MAPPKNYFSFYVNGVLQPPKYDCYQNVCFCGYCDRKEVYFSQQTYNQQRPRRRRRKNKQLEVNAQYRQGLQQQRHPNRQFQQGLQQQRRANQQVQQGLQQQQRANQQVQQGLQQRPANQQVQQGLQQQRKANQQYKPAQQLIKRQAYQQSTYVYNFYPPSYNHYTTMQRQAPSVHNYYTGSMQLKQSNVLAMPNTTTNGQIADYKQIKEQ